MKQKSLTSEQIGTVALALAQLIRAGIGTADGLHLLRQDEEDPLLRQVLQRMAERTDAGSSLASAFREAGVFPNYVCTLLSAGEQVGKTEQTLCALAEYYRGRARLESQLRTALMYPAVLMAVLLAVVTVILVWILPIFDDVYARLGSGLTGIAGGLLIVGKVLRKLLPVFALLIVAFGCMAAIKPLRQKVLAFWNLHCGSRGVLGSMQNARFIQILSLGISSGMTALESAALANELSENRAFQRKLRQYTDLLEAGRSLPQALRESGFLDSSSCRLLEAGNRSGNTDQILRLLSQQLLEKSEEDLQRAAGKAEPAMVAVACLLIGAVLLSVMLPLMNILNAIG